MSCFTVHSPRCATPLGYTPPGYDARMVPVVAGALPRGCWGAHVIETPSAETIISDFAGRVRQAANEPRIHAGIFRLD